MKPKITIGKHSGFCFGVKRAYNLACVSSKKRGNIFILGKLVHNNDVCADLYKRGIKEIGSLDAVKKGAVIFTAHGVGPETYRKAAKRGLKIIDATCPKVMKAQRLAKNFSEKKCQVLIFGDKNHKEVKSVFEWSSGKAHVIGGLDELKEKKLNKNRQHCLISQTTQNAEEFKKIVAFLRSNLKNFVYFNTICPSTYDRQREVRVLARKNDAVIVIGGKDSANSRMLFEIARKINKNTFFIESDKELDTGELRSFKNLAIAAGASTPARMIDRVAKKIQKIA